MKWKSRCIGGRSWRIRSEKKARLSSRNLCEHAGTLIPLSSAPTGPEPISVVDQTRWFLEEVHPHEPKIRAWLQSRFPQLGDIDDLVQETYLRVLRAKDNRKLDHRDLLESDRTKVS
jgi:hypothetical protein